MPWPGFPVQEMGSEGLRNLPEVTRLPRAEPEPSPQGWARWAGTPLYLPALGELGPGPACPSCCSREATPGPVAPSQRPGHVRHSAAFPSIPDR